MRKISEQESKLFWRLKAIAVFTIFFAHIPYRGDNVFMVYLFNYLGIVGVPIFLILSGFFEYGSKSPWKIKLKNLFIPLLIWGTISFLFRLIMSNSQISLQTFIDYLKWMYGCGSWLYFVPLLFWCKLISVFQNVWINLLLVITSIISIILTSFDVIVYNEYFTPYTNIFNFYIYYWFGILLRKYNIDYQNKKLVIPSFILCLVVVVFWSEIPSYFSFWCIPLSIAIYILLYNLAKIFHHGEIIGKQSYVIYLVHLVPAGIISRRIPFLWGTPFQITNVFLIFIIIVLSVFLLKMILVNLKMNKLIALLGYR